MPEAELVRTENGVVPRGEGWYVLNAREAEWAFHPKFSCSPVFEGDVRFPQFGIHVEVLEPGQPNCYYHAENEQEDFLVVAGECLLLVEGREHPLKAWDFVHCPAWTPHVFVGAGDGPCVLIAIGARKPDDRCVYPVEVVALRHGAGVQTETWEPKEAYAGTGEISRGPYPHGALPDLGG